MPRLFLLVGLSGCIPHLYTAEGANDGPWNWVAPENQWDVSEPPEGTVGVGYEPGMIVPDFRLTDQFGDEVSIWQFYGSVVLLDISTMWCAPCRDLAQYTQETVDDYADEGFVYLSVLQEDVDGEPSNLADVNAWADVYGISAPVLADPDKAGVGGAVLQGSYPALIVVDRELVVDSRVLVAADAEVRSAIEDAL